MRECDGSAPAVEAEDAAARKLSDIAAYDRVLERKRAAVLAEDSASGDPGSVAIDHRFLNDEGAVVGIGDAAPVLSRVPVTIDRIRTTVLPPLFAIPPPIRPLPLVTISLLIATVTPPVTLRTLPR